MMEMKKQSPIRRLTMLALCAAIALILSLVEMAIPSLSPVPGVKIGLPNIMTLVVFYLYDRRSALAVLLTRVVLASIFAGQLMMLPYSLSGGLLCFAVCALILRAFPLKRLWLLSMIGAVCHNIGQILAAIVLTSTPEILWYLPALLVSGLISGLVTGFAAQYVLLHWTKLNFHNGK